MRNFCRRFIAKSVLTSHPVAPLESCNSLVGITAALVAITQPANALLFYSRVSAIYLHERWAVVFFGMCWFALSVTFIHDAVYSTSDIGRIPGTELCGVVNSLGGGISYIAIAIYDTLIYAAISWKLSSLSKDGGWKSRIASLTTGAGLYRLSRSLLRYGQLYYL